jgi:DNA-binding FadR family transcriptional regulator
MWPPAEPLATCTECLAEIELVTADDFSDRPRKRPALATGVVERLVADIVTGVYPIGSPLPAEPVLCDQFWVSRTVIREATKALAEKGLVDSQQGRGTIVQDSEKWNLLDSMVLSNLFQRNDGISYLDNLIEIRVLLEASMAAKAAANASPADRQRLIRQRAVLEETLDEPELYANEDKLLHNIIMDISGDRLSAAIIRAIHDRAREAAKYNGEPTPLLKSETHRGHLLIIDAILRGDSHAAADAMKDHIQSAWERRRQGPETAKT